MIPHLIDLPYFTLWATRPNPIAGKKPLKVPLHLDGVTHHSLADPAMPLDWHTALACAEFTGTRLGFRPHTSTKVCCIDLDNCIDEHGNWSEHALTVEAMLPGAAIEESVSKRGLHFWFTYHGDGWGKRGRKGTLLGDIDLFSSADAFVAFGTYLRGDASTDLTDECQAIVELCFPSATAGPRKMSPEWEIKSPDEKARSVADLRSALAAMPSDDRHEWVAVGECLVELGDAGWELWREWSAKSPKFDEGDAAYRWSGFSGDRAGYAGVFRKAERYGWANRRGVDPVAAFTPLIQLPPGAVTKPLDILGSGLLHPDVSAKGGTIKAKVSKIAETLRFAEKQITVARDTFKDTLMYCNGDKVWKPLDKVKQISLIEDMENYGFDAIDLTKMNNACELVGAANKFDSAINWINTLAWDGVSRIGSAMHKYFGCSDNAYSKAVGEYLFTALAGRCLSPGCQADMAVIFVGLQGTGKSSTIQELVPTSEAYISITFGDTEKELAMRVKGRLLVEIPEMKGMANKEVQHIRDWITRRYEQWRAMRENDITEYKRRFVIVGTANGRELLTDPEGNRRWLPVDAGVCNPDALARDRDQLWAEGAALWAKHGVLWRDAERLAKDVHGDFMVEDAWEPRILKWLGETVFDKDRAARSPGSLNCDVPFSAADILQFALGMSIDKIKPSDAQRVGTIVRGLGMRKIRPKIDGKQQWRYVK